MIPWIQIYSNLVSHPKTANLAEHLKLSCGNVSPSVVAAGILVAFWSWAIQNALDGDLSAISSNAIAEACRWKRKPQLLVDGLIKAGFVDGDMKIHDWEEYAVLMMDVEDTRREKTRARVREYRARKKAANEFGSRANQNEPQPPSNPMPSIPNSFEADNGTLTEAEKRQKEYLAAECQKARKAFYNMVNPSANERIMVELDEFCVVLGADVCIHAFEIALDNEKTSWAYIRAILNNVKDQGIRDVVTWEVMRQNRKKDGTK